MKCLEPARLGRLELRNRIVYPPMVTSFATERGFVTDRLIAYAAERARGGVGLYTLEATYVDPPGKGFGKGVGIDADDKIPGLQRLTDAVHAHGGKASVQLHHAGRETWSSISGHPVVAPSECPVAYSDEPVHPLTHDQIAAIVQRFAEGAARAKRAGFDAVEIHGAHGYLLTQFLSPYTNKRKVTIIEMTGEIATGVHPVMRQFQLDRLAALGAVILTRHRVEAFADSHIMVVSRAERKRVGPFDSVVMALGSRSDKTLCAELDAAGMTYTPIGDCVHAGKVLEAVAGALRAAYAL